MFLGIGWLGWTLGGAADFDAFRAVSDCMHCCRCQTVRLVGVCLYLYCALAAP